MTDSPDAPLKVADIIERGFHALGFDQAAYATLFAAGDDWSVVIKASALVETVCNELIRKTVTPDIAAERLGKLPLSQKLTLARDLGLLDPERTAAAVTVLQIRNHAAHDIRVAFGFTLAGYFEQFPDRRAEFDRSMAASLSISGDAFVEPRNRIWALTMQLAVDTISPEIAAALKRKGL